MKKHIIACATLFGAAAFTTPAYANLNVFACEPEWGALATEIGGDHVNVYNATGGGQDPHKVQARPSLISRARTAAQDEGADAIMIHQPVCPYVHPDGLAGYYLAIAEAVSIGVVLYVKDPAVTPAMLAPALGIRATSGSSTRSTTSRRSAR